MNTTLSEKQIKAILDKEKRVKDNVYVDETDSKIDILLNLFDKKEITEDTLKLYTTLILLNLTKETLHNLNQNLIKNSLHIKNVNGVEENKLFLLNYSKKIYA